MPQRINAARVVVSVNMKSPTNDHPGPARTQSQTPIQNHPDLGSGRQLDYDQSIPIPSLSDRRMSRRKPGNQGINPLGWSVNRSDTFSPLQSNPEITEVVSFHSRQEMEEPDYSKITAHDTRADVADSPMITASPQLEAENLEETYNVDRPVYLLSQKYFGTRY